MSYGEKKAYYAVLMAALKVGSNAGENTVLVFDWNAQEIARATMHQRVIGLIRCIDASGRLEAESEARRRFGAGDFEVQMAQARIANPEEFPKEPMTTSATAAPTKHSAPNTAGSKATAEYREALPVADIVPDWQNRHEGTTEELQQLADSVKAEGLVQPIAVRPCPRHPRAVVLRHVVDKKEIFRVVRDSDTQAPMVMDALLYETRDKADAQRAMKIYRTGAGWQIIAGERRWRAHVLNKAKAIRAFIHKGESDATAASKQTVENTTRKDLNPIEEARQMKRLSDLKVSQKEIGRQFGGKSQPVVSQMLKLLDFPAGVQHLFATGQLSPAHAEGLSRFLPWPKACELIARECASYGWDAKRIRGTNVCNCEKDLAKAGLAIVIYTGGYSYEDRRQYQVPESLQKAFGFFKAGYDEWCYLLPATAGEPNLWEPEREKQDAARAAKAAEEKKKTAAASKANGKPTKEQLERKKKLEDSKRRRARLQDGLAKALEKMKSMKTPGVNELAVLAVHAVSGGYGSKRLQTVADALGLKVPAGVIGSGDGGGHQGFGNINAVVKMKPADIAKLAVGVILHKDTDDLCKNPRGFEPRSLKLYGVEGKA
jgi:ParB/RepB/Spo0J family partition protein